MSDAKNFGAKEYDDNESKLLEDEVNAEFEALKYKPNLGKAAINSNLEARHIVAGLSLFELRNDFKVSTTF